MLFLISLFTYKSASGFLMAYLYIIALMICAKIPAKVAFSGRQTYIGTACGDVDLPDSDRYRRRCNSYDMDIPHNAIEHRECYIHGVEDTCSRCGSSAAFIYYDADGDIGCGRGYLCAAFTHRRAGARFCIHALTSALKFIPVLLEEATRIMNAQMSRGIEFDEKNIFQKMKAMVPILIPIFVSAFQRAGDLSIAMDSRCYRGGTHRVKMDPLHYENDDIKAYVAVIVYLILNIVIAHMIPLKIL